MTRQYVETAAVAAAAAAATVMVMKMATLFLPSFRPSLFNDANDSGKDRRTDEGTSSLVPPRRRKELFKATLAARTKYVASERAKGTDGRTPTGS